MDAKQSAIDLIRRFGFERIKGIAKHGEQPYRVMAVTLLEIAGEDVVVSDGKTSCCC